MFKTVKRLTLSLTFGSEWKTLELLEKGKHETGLILS